MVGVLISPTENRVVRREMVRLPKNTAASRGIPILAGQLFGETETGGTKVTQANNETEAPAEDASPQAAPVKAESNNTPLVTGSVVVALSRAETALLDEAGYGAVERMAAEALGGLEEVSVLSNEEARDLVMKEANAAALGGDDSGVLARLARS